ncbi:unnamed protein product, partial [Rotaria sp. Silwood1]
MAQQKKTLVNNLTQSIDELSREIQHASDKVRRGHDEALEMALEWRRKQIESIEQRYISQCSSVEERFGRLISLEQDMRNRLTTEAHQPLIAENPTDETLVFTPVSKIQADQPEKHVGFSSLFEQAAKDCCKQEITWVGGWAADAEKYSRLPPSNRKRQHST